MPETLKTFVQDYKAAPSFADDAEAFAAANEFNGFEGNKIRIHELENKQIVFLDFVIFPSKYHKGATCVKAQIVFNDEKRVLQGQSELRRHWNCSRTNCRVLEQLFVKIKGGK